MRKFKKGFTIVELVIVIAVIAVLTAVLVPTFIHLTNKANKASDESLVTNLNKALAMRAADQGEAGKNNTMHDAVLDLEEEGYKVSQLITRSGEDLAWSKKANKFFLSESYNEGEYGPRYNCFHIEKSMPSTQSWGIYAGHEWTGNATGLKVSFDAGNASISEVSYVGAEAAQEVVIRTNGGNLVVNAPLDTVTHLNKSEVVEVKKVASESFHEKGVVTEKLIVSQGHVVVESQASVAQVLVSQATEAVKVTANSATTVFVDEFSTASTSVVANAENINVAGADPTKISGDNAAKVKTAVVATTLDELKSAAANEPFIRLGADLELDDDLRFPIKSTFDLNGHSLTGPSGLGLVVTLTGDLTVTDSVGHGKIVSDLGIWNNHILTVNGGEFLPENAGSGLGIYAKNGSTTTVNAAKFDGLEQAICVLGTVTINNVEIINATWGITVWGNGNSRSATLIMNGGKITASDYAISGNGTAAYAGTYIEVHGGELTGENAIYHPQNGELKIDGNAVLTGLSALYIKSGNTTISGGRFVATLEEKHEYVYNGNGTNATGDAIIIDACGYPGGNPSVEVTIKDASFSVAAANARNVAYYSRNSNTAVVLVNGQMIDPIIVS